MSLVQLAESGGAFVKKVVQQVRSHDRVIGREVTSRRHDDVLHPRSHEICIEVFGWRLLAIDLLENRLRPLQVEAGAHCWRTVCKIVVVHDGLFKSLEKQK